MYITPLVMMEIINNINSFNNLMIIGGVYVTLYILSLIMVTIWSRVEMIMAKKIEFRINRHYFNRLEQVKDSALKDSTSGEMQALVKKVGDKFYDVMRDTYTGIFALFIALSVLYYQIITTKPVIIVIICTIAMIVIVAIRYNLTRKMQPLIKIKNETWNKYNGMYLDFLSNIKTVKRLGIRDYAITNFRRADELALKEQIKVENRYLLNGSVFYIMTSLLFLGLIMYDIFTIAELPELVASLVFYIMIIGIINSELRYLVFTLDNAAEFNTSKKQLNEILNSSEDVKYIKFKSLKLENIIFNYGDSHDIKIPELIINKGDKISIVGESGQGKTTMLNIISKAIEPNSGKYLINGINTSKKIDLALISQEIDLFNLSIRDNFCLNKCVDDKELYTLFKKVGLNRWLDTLEKGFDTIIGERGVKLSAGQKQRLNIVRGILLEKDIIVLDEPTSHLDELTEERVVALMEEYFKNKTLIIVTHRPKVKSLCNKHYEFIDHELKKVSN